ncbi:hypothetical protein CAC42_1634 [Sphaceloma murrayae]|uniref:Cytosolic endo-beta-N-acetylglucosaminidase TIM barrel domain-containing protein n=1 Tax=Sphaceloma murrayae TaxID=2082308 RepID=A0A2K1QIA3_9PEZI|nr:hypothetical protein CAC42_1634 [Sphaceloma murrayae]
MGWKDFLRPIRDRLRDNLPHPEQDESDDDKRKRREKRAQDAIKGFVYFDTFDDLESWYVTDAQLHQKAIVPLLRRTASPAPAGKQVSNVTLVHDYGGAYHEYEGDGPGTFENHVLVVLIWLAPAKAVVSKLVCIPPPSWTNVLHRNGVKSLGTFLVEPGPRSVGVEKLLQQRQRDDGIISYPAAERLIAIAKSYGFDGYLINIERTFPVFKWNLVHLLGFLKQLRSAFDDGNVIWYDALHVGNSVDYQNGVTELNAALAQAAGAILTNYDWTPELARSSLQIASAHGVKAENVIFGIDIWAQNRGYEGPERRTWPREGGGGTGTGRGVAELADIGVSSGLFAPAWPYEHFDAHRKEVETSMWTGRPLPKDVACTCKPGDVHMIPLYKEYPILRFANAYPAGTASFFFSDFLPPSCLEQGTVATQLSSQSVLPLQSAWEHDQDIQFVWGTGKDGLLLRLNRPPTLERLKVTRRLFDLDMHSPEGFEACICFSTQNTSPTTSILVRFEGADSIWVAPSGEVQRETVRMQLATNKSGSYTQPSLPVTGITVEVRLDESTVGAHKSPVCNASNLLQLHSICIKRVSSKGDSPVPTIPCISREQLEDGTASIAWTIDFIEPKHPDRSGMPFSPHTGPCAHFIVEIGTLLKQRVHTCRITLPDHLDSELEGSPETNIVVQAYGFDGSMLCQSEVLWQDLPRRSSEWLLV